MSLFMSPRPLAHSHVARCNSKWTYRACPSATMLREMLRPNEYNIMQIPKCCTKNLTVFKIDPTSSNMLQHIATGWPNVRNMLCPTRLQDVALKCCERLARPLWLRMTRGSGKLCRTLAKISLFGPHGACS